jgi:uncharacterized protein YjbI with pentapeptide repeats
MADDEHLKRLREGVKAWNAWREQHSEMVPNLRRAALSEADLSGANLQGADLTAASLIRANLTGANLERATLNAADLSGAILANAHLNQAVLTGAKLLEARLDAANLGNANLQTAQLTNASLCRAYLGEANLSEARLTGAKLTEARLNMARLRGAHLDRADLSSAALAGADLTSADLGGANAIKANLRGTNLAGTNLRGALLNGADLSFANLSKADLSRAVFRGANLTDANLEGALLTGADLDRAQLKRANLTTSDLTDVQNLALDDNRVTHTRFSPKAKDEWSILRRTYTGPRLILNLLFVFLFFIPLIVKGATLWGFNEIQRPIIEANETLGGEEQISIRITCDAPSNGAITISFPAREVRTGENTSLLPAFERRVACRSMPMWMLLLGAGGPYGALMPILTAILVLYQVARFLMTNQISLMRDAEERSGVCPSRDGWFAYPNLHRIHFALNILWVIAGIAFALRAAQFLAIDVMFFGRS